MLDTTHKRSAIYCFSTAVLALMLAGCGLFGDDDDTASVDGGAGDTCMSTSDCAGAYICAGGYCQLEGSGGLGAPCWANRDCGTDLFCSSQGVCAPAGAGDVGDQCATGAECRKDLVCVSYGFTGSCQEAGTGDVGAACTDSSDCIAGLVCAPDGICKGLTEAYPPFTGAECPDDAGEFRVYFEVPRPGDPPADFYRLPFPSDARVSASGELDMDDFPRPGLGALGVDLVSLYVDALVEDFNGFSSVGAVTFRLSGVLDFDSIGEDAANMHFVNITPGSVEYGSDRSRTYSFTTARGLFACQNQFIVGNRPYQPLLPGETYAVYITTGIRSDSGETPIQDDDLVAVLSDTRPTGDEALGNAWDKHQYFRDYLADQSMAASSIAGVAVFTVQDTTGPVEALAAAVETTPLPELKNLTLCDGSTTSPCDDGDARTCGSVNNDFYEIHGRFSVPIYQEGTSPYATPADGGKIVFSGGEPVQQGTTDVCMVITIPKGASMPAGGWPLVIYAHGTGGSFKSAVGNGVAAALATASEPTAMFSYDGVVHGERRNGNPRDEDSLMFNITNPPAARDNNLQGAVDVLQALRLGDISAFDVTGVGSISFDAGNIYFFGHSQGSNVGVPAVAVSSRAKGAIFSGAGAYLTSGILNKTSPVDAKSGLEFLLGEEITESHPLMTIWQTYFDRSDTVNFAPLILFRPPSGVVTKHVFMSWGRGDTYSPNLNTMVRTLSIPIADPTVVQSINGVSTLARPISANRATDDGTRTAACFQYDPAGAYDGHFVATRDSGAVSDWLSFITSAISTGTPTVP